MDNPKRKIARSFIVPLLISAGVFTAAVLLGSCADLKSTLPGPVAAQAVAHEAGWNDPSSANFHGTYVMAHGWDLSACARCHAKSFQGGTAGVTCGSAGCHMDANGNAKSPYACNTCHGTFSASVSDTASWAPPRSLAGDTLEDAPGVGAHQPHLAEGELGHLVRCQECHAVPARFSSPGHITPGVPASVVFTGSLANKATEGGLVATPSFDRSTLRCSNVYCHGTFRLVKSQAPLKYQFAFEDTVIEGAHFAPLWVGGGTETTCGNCHGLPPQGHISVPNPLTRCGNSGCHPGIVDAQGNIIDPTRHINGKIDVQGEELDY